jgi:hypothetical protein
MKTIPIPSAFHEVLGHEQTVVELLLIIFSSVGGTAALFFATPAEWGMFAWWQTLLLLLLIFDILAGFVANLTFSTNHFYHLSPKMRTIFIAIHVQPLIFAFYWGEQWGVCAAVWLYTIVSVLLVNYLHHYPAQKVVAGGLTAGGLLGLLLQAAGLPTLLLVALVFYQLKVIYSFGVHHYPGRSSAHA